MKYKSASSSEYLVITGGWIQDIKLTRKSWVFPWQKCTRIDLSPVNYTFEVQAMSAEKLPFILPAVFTIGPREDDPDSLLKYAKLLSSHDTTSNHVNELVEGVIEGETRVLAASMTMEDIFRGTKQFKQEVFDKVQLELNQFGLLIYNANVKQLVDVAGHEYFSYLGQKVQMDAANQAKIDVAEAKTKGEVGAKSQEGKTIQNAAKIDAETKIYTTQRQGEGKKQELKVETEIIVYKTEQEAVAAEAATALAMKKAGWAKEAEVAQVESRKAVAIREAELQREVERMNALTTTEKLKADLLSKANVDYETKAQEANADLYKKQKLAEAHLYQKQKESEAEFYAQKQKVDAELYAKMKEAEALKAIGEAHAAFISSTMGAFKGNYAAMRDYLMIERGLFKDIARINADAVRGLEPRLSVWTGAGAGAGSGDAMKEVAGLYRMLPPLMATVHEQTGMIPPSWMGQLAQTDQQPLTR